MKEIDDQSLRDLLNANKDDLKYCWIATYAGVKEQALSRYRKGVYKELSEEKKRLVVEAMMVLPNCRWREIAGLFEGRFPPLRGAMAALMAGEMPESAGVS